MSAQLLLSCDKVRIVIKGRDIHSVIEKNVIININCGNLRILNIYTGAFCQKSFQTFGLI